MLSSDYRNGIHPLLSDFTSGTSKGLLKAKSLVANSSKKLALVAIDALFAFHEFSKMTGLAALTSSGQVIHLLSRTPLHLQTSLSDEASLTKTTKYPHAVFRHLKSSLGFDKSSEHVLEVLDQFYHQLDRFYHHSSLWKSIIKTLLIGLKIMLGIRDAQSLNVQTSRLVFPPCILAGSLSTGILIWNQFKSKDPIIQHTINICSLIACFFFAYTAKHLYGIIKDKDLEMEQAYYEDRPAAQLSQDVLEGLSIDRAQTFKKGCFGSVYRLQVGSRSYAIKYIDSLPEGLSIEDLGKRHRWFREQTIALKVKHPYIGTTFALGTNYFIMDFIENTLSDKMAEVLQWHSLKRLELLARIVLGIAYLHANFIVHRDLKPKNIMLTEDNIPKIIDFGTSRHISPIRRSNSILGTKGYMAPEIYQQIFAPQIQPYDPYAADLYSLGIIGRELLKPEAKQTITGDFLNKILAANPRNRLGAKEISEIKHHPLFQNINWKELENPL